MFRENIFNENLFEILYNMETFFFIENLFECGNIIFFVTEINFFSHIDKIFLTLKKNILPETSSYTPTPFPLAISPHSNPPQFSPLSITHKHSHYLPLLFGNITPVILFIFFSLQTTSKHEKFSKNIVFLFNLQARKSIFFEGSYKKSL